MKIIKKIAPEVGKWADKNFQFHGPIFGIAEEAGELVHSLLKWAQGIRGTPEEHQDNIKDSLADISIYASHALWKYKNSECHDQIPIVGSHLLGTLFVQIGYLLQEPNRIESQLPHIMNTVEQISLRMEIPLDEAILETWKKVKQRDWKKFPFDGLTK